MNIVGVIAEYNPFHNGHCYHLEQARYLSGADYVVAVMSPDFVQRGEPALFPKELRSEMALRCGADLVLELPVCYAAGSAEYFAQGAVSLLEAIGADTLCFGCETPDAELFQSTASILLQEPESYVTALREQLGQGYSFPKARAAALCAYIAGQCDSDADLTALTEFLSTPNNILGTEYCKAMQKLGSSMKLLPVRRIGSGYHDDRLTGGFCSATALRSALKKTPSESDQSLAEKNIPAAIWPLFLKGTKQMLTADDLLPYLNQKLLSSDRFDHILDISSDLSDRIRSLRYSCMGRSWEEILQLLTTKQMTEARIRRALLHLILDITTEETEYFRENGTIFYARVLGFRKESSALLKQIKKEGTVPLLTKPAHASKLLDKTGQEMLSQDFRASHLGRSIRSLKYHIPFRTEYEISPYIQL